MTLKQFLFLMPILVSIILFLGILRAVIDPSFIGQLIGAESGVTGVITGLGIGAVMFMPGFVAFPLAAGFLEIGAGYPQVAAFIGSLMGIGVTTILMETRYFGMKLTVLRNLFCLMSAATFAFVMWGVGL